MKVLKFCKRHAKKIIAGLWITGFIICLLVSQFRTSAAYPVNTTVTASLNLNGFSPVTVGQTAYDEVMNNVNVVMYRMVGDQTFPVSMSLASLADLPYSGVSDGSSGDPVLCLIQNVSDYNVDIMVYPDGHVGSAYTVSLIPGQTSTIYYHYFSTVVSDPSNITIQIDMGYPPTKSPVNGTLYLEAVLPDGTREIIRYYNPDSTTDPYYVNLSSVTWPTINGYSPNSDYLASLPSGVYIVDSTSRTISVPYFRAGRVAYITYYSSDGTQVMHTETRFISDGSGQLTFTTWRGNDVFPKVISYYAGTSDISVSVYLLNLTSQLDGAYRDGYQAGLEQSEQDAEYWEDRVDQALKEGYVDGYNDGLLQNTLLEEDIQEIKKEYNAITAFFDGLWRSCVSFFDYVGNGIDINGVSLKTIVITLAAITLVSVVAVFILKK